MVPCVNPAAMASSISHPIENLEDAVQFGTPDQVLGYLKEGANANGRVPHSGLPYLHYCFKLGDLEKASYLLAYKADPYQTNNNQATLFEWALSQRSPVMLEFLLQYSSAAKWRVHSENSSQPVIHKLVRSHRRQMLTVLFKNGWDINQPDDRGNTALIEAVRTKNTDMLQFLVSRKADLYRKNKQDHDALYFSIENKRSEPLRILLRAGFDPHRRYEKDLTALMFAVTQKNLTAVEALLRAGSDLEAVNAEGENALALALHSQYFRIDIFQSLLKHCANPNVFNKEGQTLLAQAVFERCHACVDELLTHKDRVNDGGQSRNPGSDYYSWPPLFWAVEKQDTYLVETLLKAGANIHQRHSKENTTVMFVAIRDATADAKMVRLLIKHGAKVNVTDKDHWPLLVKASATEGIAVLKALIEAGVDVNQPNWHGWTPLMAAAQTGSSEKVALLLKHGANINARSRRGWTALSEAKRAGHFDVVTLLTKAGGADPIKAQPKTRKDRGNLKVEIKVLD